MAEVSTKDREEKEVRPPECDYLCVDDFLATLVDARSLAAALELGLIDTLARGETLSAHELRSRCSGDARGFRLLIDLLRQNRVVEAGEAGIRITASFRSALAYRDLLEAKLAFARLVLPDFVEAFPLLVRDPARFVRSAGLFHVFDYGRAVASTPENIAHTRQWVRITTAWTRYEVGVCLKRHDFTRHRRMLDVGGNSGEFVLRACRQHPALQGTVIDLPAVCRIGRDHVRDEPEADRITFQEADFRTDPLPGGFDLVSFKSALHDWPEAQARRLLTEAHAALTPGGTVLVFERAPMEGSPACRSFSALPFLLFSPWFRPPEVYADWLKELSCREIDVQRFDLDTPFLLVRGRKAG